MQIIKRECIPGSTIFYIADGIPHTAVVKTNVYKDYYEIENKTFLDEYEDDCGIVLKDVCTHTNEIWLPKHPDEIQLKYFIELARGNIKSFPRRVLYQKNATAYRPLIEFEEGLIFKLIRDVNYYYYHEGKDNICLIDIHDNSRIRIPKWEDHDYKINPNDLRKNKIINEDDVEEIYSFNSYLGIPSYENIHTPISKFYNLVYRR